ncbi:MAG: hypothetical protein JSU86_03525 [Phycisphaerales bacterium]|nr:MAG: hypothetical protein JSU86_03525 [Phycisphaerales bacterium]
MGPIHMIFVFLGALFRSQAGVAAENLALRQQLAMDRRLYLTECLAREVCWNLSH